MGLFDNFGDGVGEFFSDLGDTLSESATSILDVGEQQLGVLITGLGVEDGGDPVESGNENRDPRLVIPGDLSSRRLSDFAANALPFASVPPSLVIGAGVAAALLAVVLVGRALR